MVRRDIAGRGVRDPRVLDAMEAVRRELFVPEDERYLAYEDHPLPIGAGQTISQPYVVALMAEAAAVGHGDRVLEVGTGSGYGAAVLARLAAEVWTVERIASLAEAARASLAEHARLDAGTGGGGRVAAVHVEVGDGSLGWPSAAPYQAIVVTAAAPEVPPALLGQLDEGGRLVLPVGQPGGQSLMCLTRSGDGYEERDLGGVAFVPLIGEQGHTDR
jgi:protein-L-isoaspartate(D-aspartate) O-methyltransferase